MYQSVCDALRWRLDQGDFNGGTRLPSLRELSKRFNVSTITVRQALRHLEKEGHLQCIPGVGVFVQPAVPNRAANGQTTVALATIEIEGGLTAQMAESIEEACRERGWGMQLFSAHGETALEARNLSHIAESGLKGVIILPGDSTENLEAMVRLKLNGCPMVLAGRALPGLKVDVVESDHEKGAYLATEYLLAQGHRRVLMVTQKPTPTSAAARLKGYEQALVDHGLEPMHAWKVWIDNAVTAQGTSEDERWFGGYAAVLPVLKEWDLPIAVLAHDAHSGWGVFEACRELGLNIPNDVSIVCLEDAEFARALTPPMTAIRQRTDEVARTAVELLERRLMDETGLQPQHVLLDVELIERGSVAPAGKVVLS
ncbi:MAG: GntR family transcriptional regulator [Planctomycetes bacterium]|nr:GntR family transcriptional regulator [Planctomycetota bacterium]